MKSGDIDIVVAKRLHRYRYITLVPSWQTNWRHFPSQQLKSTASRENALAMTRQDLFTSAE